MCLAVPAEVVSIEGEEATVDFGGVKRKANISLLENVNIGDHVIVHVGFAIQKLDGREAEESLKFWKKILEEESEL